MPKFSSSGDSPKWVKSKRREREKERKRDRKLVITLASYALQRQPSWRTQSRLGQKKERRRERLNNGNNIGQLRIANPTLSGACKAAWANLK